MKIIDAYFILMAFGSGSSVMLYYFLSAGTAYFFHGPAVSDVPQWSLMWVRLVGPGELLCSVLCALAVKESASIKTFVVRTISPYIFLHMLTFMAHWNQQPVGLLFFEFSGMFVSAAAFVYFGVLHPPNKDGNSHLPMTDEQ